MKVDEENGSVLAARRDRDVSLSLVAAALEHLTVAGHQQRASIDALPTNLHEDAADVLVNVEHFIDDADIRGWDERYRRMQEDHLRGLIRSLRDGAACNRETESGTDSALSLLVGADGREPPAHRQF